MWSTKHEEHTLHRKVHRSWVWYDSIDGGGRFKVKRIQVKLGARRSLQNHHRTEHWMVLKGTTEITIGDKKLLLTENQSTYIPLGEVHRLANPRHHSAGNHRGAVGQLAGRRRYCSI